MWQQRLSPLREQGKGAEKAQATRAALIELAAKLFAERGYVQSSIRDLAREANLTTGAVYGHFRNKADLLAEAISERTAAEFKTDEPAMEVELFRDSLTKSVSDYPKRRRLRALIVQGAAAAQTDPETRDRLREEQLFYLNFWIDGWKQQREEFHIDPSVDIDTAVLFTWAAELGLGVLEGVGIEPKSKKAWADAFDRFRRSLELPPEEPKPNPPRQRARKQT